MILESYIGNIREGVHAGAMAIHIVLDGHPTELNDIETLFQGLEQQLKVVAHVYVYVRRDGVTPQNIALFVRLATLVRDLKGFVQLVTHEQRVQTWFQFAHWITYKVSYENFTGILGNEYHVMLLAGDLEDPRSLPQFPQTVMYVVPGPEVEVQAIAEWINTKAPHARLLSPQKLAIKGSLT
jgi:hypothetical protein